MFTLQNGKTFDETVAYKVICELYSDDACSEDKLIAKKSAYFNDNNLWAELTSPSRDSKSIPTNKILISDLENNLLKLNINSIGRTFEKYDIEDVIYPDQVKVFYKYYEDGVWSDYTEIGNAVVGEHYYECEFDVSDFKSGLYSFKSISHFPTIPEEDAYFAFADFSISIFISPNKFYGRFT